MDESFDVAAPYTVGVAAQDAPDECDVLVVFDPPPWAFWFEPVTHACKLPARCRLPSLTWEFGSPCHSLNRLESYAVVVSLGGQSSVPSRILADRFTQRVNLPSRPIFPMIILLAEPTRASAGATFHWSQ
jgi:hypothetical protein